MEDFSRTAVSLTDERVRWEQPPFDLHRILFQSASGDETGNQTKVYQQPINGQAMDELFMIPAVGRAGRASKSFGAILPFDAGLQ